MKNFFIGIDCGTQLIKAAIFDINGNLISQSKMKLNTKFPNPGWAEQDAIDWWTSLCKVLRSIANIIGKERIVGLGIAYQRETFVCLDKNNKEIRPAILWLDQRATNELIHFKREFGEDIFLKTTGKFLDTTPSSVKIKWIKDNEPENFRKINKLMDVGTYLHWKLTGEVTGSLPGLDALGILDVKEKKWSEDILEYLNLSYENMPNFVTCGTRIGGIKKDVATKVGLPTGLPVIAAGGDGQVFAIGVNSIDDKDIALSLGTSVICGIHSSKYLNNQYSRTMIGCLPDSYYYESVLRTGSHIVTWFINNILCDYNGNKRRPHKNMEELLSKAIAKIKPGCNGLITIPYWRGGMMPYNDPDSRGITIGWSDYHTKLHFYRSILEGIAFEIRLVIESYSENLKLEPKSIKIGSGGANSIPWTQIICDVNNLEVIVPDNLEGTALGAAMITAWGLDYYKKLSSASKNMYKIGRKVVSNKKNSKTYSELYNSIYKKLYPAIRDSLNNLGKFALNQK